jgi:hypothetical protein
MNESDKSPSLPPKAGNTQSLFLILIAFPGIMFLVHPNTTPAGLIFRLSLMLVGAVGWTIYEIGKKS